MIRCFGIKFLPFYQQSTCCCVIGECLFPPSHTSVPFHGTFTLSGLDALLKIRCLHQSLGHVKIFYRDLLYNRSENGRSKANFSLDDVIPVTEGITVVATQAHALVISRGLALLTEELTLSRSYVAQLYGRCCHTFQ